MARQACNTCPWRVSTPPGGFPGGCVAEDLQALIDEVRALRDRVEKAEANDAFMVERAANQHLEGQRKPGATAANAEKKEKH